ncbi:MAG: hypothetical protein ABWZ88_12935 [Variovorax sp.]
MSHADANSTPTPERPQPDEPEITQEESVPSDGKDAKGEKMMEELGRERGRQQDKAAPPS